MQLAQCSLAGLRLILKKAQWPCGGQGLLPIPPLPHKLSGTDSLCSLDKENKRGAEVFIHRVGSVERLKLEKQEKLNFSTEFSRLIGSRIAYPSVHPSHKSKFLRIRQSNLIASHDLRSLPGPAWGHRRKRSTVIQRILDWPYPALSCLLSPNTLPDELDVYSDFTGASLSLAVSKLLLYVACPRSRPLEDAEEPQSSFSARRNRTLNSRVVVKTLP